MENVQTNVLSKDQKRNFVEQVAACLDSIVPDPDVRRWIGCQFALESDFGTSHVVEKYCNYCGMKIPVIRPSSRIRYLNGDFAYYDSFESCVLDYVLWFTWKRVDSITLNAKYMYKDFIKKSGYCPEEDYVKRIDFIYNFLY